MNKPRIPGTVSLKWFLLTAAMAGSTLLAITPAEFDALKAKAEAGNGIAQYNLGLRYADKQEAFADPIESYVWLNLAADNGATGNALMIIATKLDPAQISEGKTRLAARREGRPISPVSAAPEAAANPVVAAASISDAAIKAEAELAKISAELANAWKETEQLKTSLAAATTELGTLRANAANFEGERNGLMQKIAASAGDQTQIQQAQAEIAQLKLQANALAAETQKAQSQLTATQNMANSETSRLQNDLATAQNRIASLETAVTRSQDEKSALIKDANSAALAAGLQQELSNELKDAKTQLAAAQEKLAAQANQPAIPPEVQREMETLQVKLDSSLRAYQLKVDEIAGVQKALANIESERAQTSDTLDQTKSQLASAETDLAAARAQISSHAPVLAEVNSLREQVRQMQNQVASLAGENSQLKNRVALAGASPSSLLAAPTRPGASAPARPTSLAAPVPPAPEAKTHTVAMGETLTQIARRYYGNSERWTEILEANKALIKDPRALSVGMKLRIP